MVGRVVPGMKNPESDRVKVCFGDHFDVMLRPRCLQNRSANLGERGVGRHAWIPLDVALPEEGDGQARQAREYKRAMRNAGQLLPG